MASHRRTTQSLPIRHTPAHERAAAARAGARPAAPSAPVRSRARRIATSVLLLAGALVVALLARWLIYGDALRVRDVRLVGVQAADPLAVSEAANIAGKTVLTIDRGKIADAVSRVPGVKSVTVRRDWPRGVVIDVTEHQGWGYWEVGGRHVIVDHDGQVIEHGRPPADQAITIYEEGGDPASPQLAPDPDTVQLVRRLLDSGSFSILRVTPTGFTFSRERGLTVHVHDGPSAIFGDSHNFDFKVATWGSLLDRIESQHLAVTEIDLRFGKNVVIR